MHYLYISYSNSANKYYVGETHNIDERIQKHNIHIYKNSYTKISNDWVIALTFDCNCKEDAIYLESFIKKMKSKKFIEKIILNPTILSDILLKKG